MNTNKFIKKVVIVMIAIVAGLIGCQKDEASDQSALPLIAPSGDKISKSYALLKKELSDIITSDFDILDIEYLPIQAGYVAMIEYESTDGTISSLIMTNLPLDEPLGEIAPSTTRLKSGSESSGGGGSVTITCNKLGNCDCSPWAELDISTGKVRYGCGSNCGGQCSITIKLN